MSSIQPVEPIERATPIYDVGEWLRRLPGSRAAHEPLGEVDVRLLPPGTTLAVDTTNSLYHVVLQDEPGVATIQGGTSWPAPAPAFIVGSRGSGVGSLLGIIAIGLRMEVLTDGQRVLTSRVRHITVTPPQAD